MKRVTVRLATRWGCELRAKNEKRKKGLIFKSKDEYLGQNKMERQTPLTHPPPRQKKAALFSYPGIMPRSDKRLSLEMSAFDSLNCG